MGRCLSTMRLARSGTKSRTATIVRDCSPFRARFLSASSESNLARSRTICYIPIRMLQVRGSCVRDVGDPGKLRDLALTRSISHRARSRKTDAQGCPSGCEQQVSSPCTFGNPTLLPWSARRELRPTRHKAVAERGACGPLVAPRSAAASALKPPSSRRHLKRLSRTREAQRGDGASGGDLKGSSK